jgi:hypothetical protein
MLGCTTCEAALVQLIFMQASDQRILIYAMSDRLKTGVEVVQRGVRACFGNLRGFYLHMLKQTCNSGSHCSIRVNRIRQGTVPCLTLSYVEEFAAIDMDYDGVITFDDAYIVMYRAVGLL